MPNPGCEDCFSSAPGILRIFALVPALASSVFLITALWMLIAMVVAVRQALDYDSMTQNQKANLDKLLEYNRKLSEGVAKQNKDVKVLKEKVKRRDDTIN